MQKKNSSTSVLILAGGLSKRAEITKGLRVVSNKFWLEKQIDFFTSIGLSYVFVALGFDSEKYFKSIPMLQQSIKEPIFIDNTRVSTIINPTPENGMFSTLQFSLNAICNLDWNNLFIIHIDSAIPKIYTITKILEYSNYKVVKPIFNKTSGHPILLNKNFCQFLSQVKLEKEKARLDYQIREINQSDVFYIELDDSSILLNMNTKLEWDKYIETL